MRGMEREQKNLANVIPLQQYKREQSQCSVHTMGLPTACSYGWIVSVMQIDHGTARANLSAAGLSWNSYVASHYNSNKQLFPNENRLCR